MQNAYLIVEKSALPDYFCRVVEAHRLLENGSCTQVSDAVRMVGISRSTYYKYKDRVMEPSNVSGGRKATLMLNLEDRAGVLSRVLNLLAEYGASVLTLTQSLPVHALASVMLSIDIAGLNVPVEKLMGALETANGVEKTRLVAIE